MPYGVAMSRRSVAVRRRGSAAAAAVLVGAVLPLAGLAGCGGTTAPADAGVTSTAPDAGAADCRAQWRQMADSLTGRDQQVDPSDLADRWTSVLATAQYYATSATAQDCGAALTGQQDAVRKIQAWSAQLRDFDVPYRFAALAPVATDYLLASPSPSRSASAGRQPGKGPTAQQLQAALTTLQDTATLATTDMQAGWDEATAVDLDDAAAVKRTLDDLAFLARDSTPYQKCLAALIVLERARAATS